MKHFILGSVLTFLFSISSFANQNSVTVEPPYCNPQVFFSKEDKQKTQLERARIFKLGEMTLMGLAVGNSKNQRVIDFANAHSNFNANENYCTWYYNDGDSTAAETFNHYYVKNPSSLNTKTGPALFRQVLKDQFANARPSFLSCLQDHKYLAMGCDGQKHRGPTVFGMLLSYSGCAPEHAAIIVNTLWGLNGVKPEVRIAIIAEGKKLGDEDPEARRRLQQAFGYVEN